MILLPRPGRPTHHFTRRTARVVAARYNRRRPADRKAVVVEAERGPFGWRCEIRRAVPLD